MKTIARRRWYFIPPLVLAALAAFSLLSMVLWNALMPGIFRLPEINFWQAAGLIILSRLFFGGGHWNRGMHHNWRNRMREKWEKMTPEEREQFRRQWPHHSHGWDGCWGENRFQEKKEDQTV
ncbi:MAG TPA: hypothetical protein VIH57_03280 [Bacteroidales bacterium]